MIDVTLCLLVRGDPPEEILLGFKKVGFGAGKYNGFGGKVESGETITGAAVREVAEEVGVRIAEEDLRLVARLTFLFSAEPALDKVAHVFLTTAWDGIPVESREMAPEWFAVHQVPYGQMWQGDVHWLPRVLKGERVQGCITFGGDNETVIAWEMESMGRGKRCRFPVAVHLFFVRGDEVLLLRRFNTGYEDGKYSVVAGHVDAGESVTQTAIREAREEVGVEVWPQDLEVVGVMHRKSDDERVDFFLVTKAWSGELVNREMDKCDELRWSSMDALPANVIPYVRRGLANYRRGLWFDEFGW